MNVLFIGKYPPIEGGTSSTAYWRHDELKKYNINFEVITCILNDSEYFIRQCYKKKYINIISEKIPWHIPYSQLYSEQLISMALKIASEKRFDAVEGAYLFPYGFAAFVVAKILDKPLILRHSGSDLYRVISTGQFDDLLREMTSSAKVIVTYKDCEEKWKKINKDANLYFTERYIPNPLYFYTSLNRSNAIFIGKITEKWNRNQLEYFFLELKKRKYMGDIFVYSNSYTIDVFKEYFEKRDFIVKAKSFIMPEEVPGILRNAKYILLSETPSGIIEESNLYSEAIMCGCDVICINKHSMPRVSYDEYIKAQVKIYKEIIS